MKSKLATSIWSPKSNFSAAVICPGVVGNLIETIDFSLCARHVGGLESCELIYSTLALKITYNPQLNSQFAAVLKKQATQIVFFSTRAARKTKNDFHSPERLFEPSILSAMLLIISKYSLISYSYTFLLAKRYYNKQQKRPLGYSDELVVCVRAICATNCLFIIFSSFY